MKPLSVSAALAMGPRTLSTASRTLPMCACGSASMALLACSTTGWAWESAAETLSSVCTSTVPSCRSVERLTPWRLWATGISAFCMRLSACSTTPRAARMSSPSTGSADATFQSGPSTLERMSETSEAICEAVWTSESPSPLLRASPTVEAWVITVFDWPRTSMASR